MNFREQVAHALAEYTGLKLDQVEELLTTPPQPSMGDLAFPCFVLAQNEHKNPAQMSAELAVSMPLPKEISSLKNVGPFLNFFVDKSVLNKSIIESKVGFTEEEKEGIEPEIILEYPSPNTNKPLHLGHIRNLLLGNAIRDIYKHLGARTVTTNLVNDRGIHICKSMLAYQKWGNNEVPKQKTDKFVGNLYVRFSKEVKKDPSLDEQAQAMLQAWEEGDPEVIKLWKMMNEWAYEGHGKVYKLLDYDPDQTYVESKLYKEGKDIVMDGLAKGIFAKDETGAIYCDLERFGLGKKILVRADGTTIYITQDIFLALKRFRDFNIEKSVYVVGSEQGHHFKVLFTLLELLGYDWAKRAYHYSYGMVNLPHGRMKSREGTVVDAANIIEEVIRLAEAEILIRHPGLDGKELKKRAHEIGLAALKFFILKVDPRKEMLYHPEESISFEGETGPYVQYTAARINSIMKKSDIQPPFTVDNYGVLDHKLEHALITELAMFKAVVLDAAKQFKPSLIARYLLDLCQLFNEFYHQVHVNQEQDVAVKTARLRLLQKVRETISEGLGLLGIESPEEM